MPRKGGAAVCRALFIFGLLFCAAAIGADTIYLRGGRVYHGKILNQTPKAVLIRTRTGTKTIRKKLIRRITYETYEEALAKERARRARLRRLRAERLRKEAEERRKREIAAALKAREAFRRQQALARAERAAFLRKQVATGKIKKEDVDEPIEFWDFAWRSLVIPGWGHYTIDKPVFAVGYAGATVLLLANTVQSRQSAVAAQQRNAQEVDNNTLLSFLSAQNQTTQAAGLAYGLDANRRFLTDYQQKIDRYHASLASLAILYGVQLIHIILDGITWEEGGLLGARGTGDRSLRLDLRLSEESAPESLLGAAPGWRGEIAITGRF